MSKEICYKLNNYIIAIDICEGDLPCVSVGKHLTKDVVENIFAYYDKKVVDFFLQLIDLLAEKETRIAELEDKDWYEGTIKQLEEQNGRLIEQLAEKDKEVEICQNAIKKLIRNCNTVMCKNKIDYAVEKLEKVKEFLEPKYFDNDQINYLAKIIDQLITEIKEGK